MTHKGTVTLETERLILRKFSPDDAEPMYRNWASDPEVSRTVMWQTHDSLEATQKVIASWVEDYESPAKYEWAIVLRSLGEPIGSIAAMSANDDVRAVTVGYNIGKAWWGNGYVTEALNMVIRFLFEEVGLNRIQADYLTINPASGAVMRKCGLKFEGIKRQCIFSKGKIYDLAMYAILAEDYFGKTSPTNTTLTSALRNHALVMFHNAETAIKTCDLDFDLCEMPIWKHVYHLLHSCDRWFINPTVYDEPRFHTDGLNSLDAPPSGEHLSRELLLDYLGQIQQKILTYIDGMTDEMLTEIPKDCKSTRFGLAMSAFRHWYAHLGNINATTIIETGKWPRVVGHNWLEGMNAGLWE
jgi:ribosomal-protein-alanine N-acetyltransferase